MLIKVIRKLESYSLKKQFFILFFVATLDVWIMPILSILIYITGLSEVVFFQIPWDKEGFGNVFRPKVITDFGNYATYIYIPMPKITHNFTPTINVFHIISYVLFLILLFRSSLNKNKKNVCGLVGLVVYLLIGYGSAIAGLIGFVLAKSIGSAIANLIGY